MTPFRNNAAHMLAAFPMQLLLCVLQEKNKARAMLYPTYSVVVEAKNLAQT